MSRPVTPYSGDLGDTDPLPAIRTSIDAIHTLANGWAADRFERSYAAGKWSARQVLTHLAQTELALGTRARMAVVTPQYAAQGFDQDVWIRLDAGLSGKAAADAFVAIGRMNLAFFERLTPAERAVTLSHPEYGTLTVDWIIHQMAGHQIHHLRQLQTIP
jgi:DinB family protein